MKKVTPGIVLIYALLVFVGGLMGHYKAASTASLISGIGFGSALLICAWGMYRKNDLAYYGALIITFVLDAFFTFRFAKTLKFFPPGFMSLLSLAVLILLALRIRKKFK